MASTIRGTKVAKSTKSSKKKVAKKKASVKKEAKISDKQREEEAEVAKLAKTFKKTNFDLVIVESPSKATTLKKYLGKDFEVLASKGHIKDLPKSKLGVDVEGSFDLEIVPIPGKKAIIDRIKIVAKAANNIYLAPDPDREGEAIAFHLAEEIKRPKHTKRVLFNAITKKNILEAINNPTELNAHKYDSQKTRRILDRLVGYKISPILWDKVQRGLSAGRVQSVALRMVVDREDEVTKFVPEQSFSIHAKIKKNDMDVESQYFAEKGQKNEELKDEKRVSFLLKELENKKFTIEDIKKKERRQSPTPPFTTAKLQQEAATKLGFSAQRTMSIAQKLYEGIKLKDDGPSGLITYMRTDSVRVDPQAISDVRDYIKRSYGEEYLPETPNMYQKKSQTQVKAQDAHEAIRPTNLDFLPAKIKADLSDDEYKLYSLIWNKFIASQMSQAILEQTTVMFNAEGYLFKTTGSLIKFAGFRTVYLESLMEKKQNQDEESSFSFLGERILPPLELGEVFSAIEKPLSREHWTSPPPRFSEATLVKDLDENGIGRPSTYAAIISNLQDRNYVQKLENRFRPTDLGTLVCQMLVKSFPSILDVEFTANIENQLDQIENGEISWKKVLKSFYGPFEKTLEKAKEEMKNLKKMQIPSGIDCRKCEKGEYLVKWGRNGQFLACSEYPECKSSEDFKRIPDGKIEIVEKEYTKEKCPTCSKRMIVKSGRYGRFFACEDYPNCKTALPYTIDVACPKCKKGKFAEKKGRFKLFYGCSTYPECDNAVWDYPVAQDCPECHYPVVCKKTSKKIGDYLQCPECKFKIIS